MTAESEILAFVAGLVFGSFVAVLLKSIVRGIRRELELEDQYRSIFRIRRGRV